jgi:hypothetical protein
VAAQYWKNVVGEETAREAVVVRKLRSFADSGTGLSNSEEERKAERGLRGKQKLPEPLGKTKTSETDSNKGQRGSEEPIRSLVLLGFKL